MLKNRSTIRYLKSAMQNIAILNEVKSQGISIAQRARDVNSPEYRGIKKDLVLDGEIPKDKIVEARMVVSTHFNAINGEIPETVNNREAFNEYIERQRIITEIIIQKLVKNLQFTEMTLKAEFIANQFSKDGQPCELAFAFGAELEELLNKESDKK